ncbi:MULTISPECIES: carbohydrate ABC transporter permease [Halanaerobium]|jgi:multiple sugar transport system permease protein|uniref:Carbohydrate ABC transporter membrane protein 1 (CUT1 family) n=1 Tax=Halanaerobium saccharolyticum TaxID=43595 RepID=A0A4R6SKY5_9FIRM|nr:MULTISPECIES: sugar ABC transporter permease [Halanaerobium]PUU93922.1 MAG: multiple sugar transport system permease protein [Halanaerobium sp.]TDQ01718.1 carbohydrate ABC transporter membrane protein 1 (CUT1 family) [Halanaerobium saccharolyticum]
MLNKIKEMKEKMSPYLLLTPFLFWLVVFFGYAFFRAFYFSFTDYNLFNEANFIGLGNYIKLFNEYLFGRALKNTITFSVIVTTVQTFIALVLAVILNQKIKGIKIFRTIYYLPSITSSVVITLIFMWIFQKQGIFNYLLTLFNRYQEYVLLFLTIFILTHLFMVLKEKFLKRPVKVLEPSYIVLSLIIATFAALGANFFGIIGIREVADVETIWLNTREMIPAWAGPFAFPRPLAAIMLLNIWTTVPTMMILYLAGLQDIPGALYEAAEVDGATTWQKFWKITVPQLKHITFLVMTMGFIGTLQMFDQVAIIGGQAPLESTVTLAYYVYVNMFPSSARPAVGLASAAAMILAILTLIFVYLQRRITGEGRE